MSLLFYGLAWFSREKIPIRLPIPFLQLCRCCHFVSCHFVSETRQVSSMIHSASPQSRPAVIVAWFWSFGTDGRSDTLCENSDHYRQGHWSSSWIKINGKSTCNSTFCYSNIVNIYEPLLRCNWSWHLFLLQMGRLYIFRRAIKTKRGKLFSPFVFP